MKLDKDYIVDMNNISATDADIRYAEFIQYKNLEPEKKNYRFNIIQKLWPEAEYFDKKNIEGFCGEYKGKYLIIFRGTDSLRDWITNFMFFRKCIPYKGTNPKIKVHSGFLKDYLEVRDFIHKKVENTKLDIVVHGHSKGAAITGLCALDLQYNFPNKNIAAVALGMPRIGNKEFKRSFDGRLPDFLRADYGSDIIPQIPPKIFGFRHVGNFIQLGKKRRWGVGTKKHHNWRLYYIGLNYDLD